MRHRIGWSVVAMAVATWMAGSPWASRQARADDPLTYAVIPHEPVPADLSILADPRTIKTNIRTPGSTGRTATGTSPTTEGGPEAAVADPTPYPVKLDRAMTAGQAFETQITANRDLKTELTPSGAAAPIVNDASLKIEISGHETVVSVDDKGVPTEFNLTVGKFTIDGKDAAAPGKVINAKGDKDKGYAYMMDGVPASDEMKDALSLVFDQGASDLAPFETASQHKMGDSWPIDAGVAAKDVGAAAKDLMKDKAMTVDAKDVSGQATIKAVETVTGGAKALRIKLEGTDKNIKLSDPATVVDKSEVTSTTTELVPVEAGQLPLERVDTSDVEFHTTAPEVKDTHMRVDMSQTITPAK